MEKHLLQRPEEFTPAKSMATLAVCWTSSTAAQASRLIGSTNKGVLSKGAVKIQIHLEWES